LITICIVTLTVLLPIIIGLFLPSEKSYTKTRIFQTTIENITIKTPFFRTLALLFVDIDKQMDLYLENVAIKLGEK
jgi:hypothetical protein